MSKKSKFPVLNVATKRNLLCPLQSQINIRMTMSFLLCLLFKNKKVLHTTKTSKFSVTVATIHGGASFKNPIPNLLYPCRRRSQGHRIPTTLAILSSHARLPPSMALPLLLLLLHLLHPSSSPHHPSRPQTHLHRHRKRRNRLLCRFHFLPSRHGPNL